MKNILIALIYIVVAPILGGLIAGLDRKITARLQSRVGPPILQPFYDVFKLMQKQTLSVNGFQTFYITGFLVFIILTGVMFFAGADLLLAIFAFTVASIFLVIGAYSANSPYSNIGAERELLQMMAYEPMLIITAIGFYMVTGSFKVADIIASSTPVIAMLPGVFIGFIFILTIKLRKSPFDLSTSHHGHQELVKGLTTEFSGTDLAIIEVAHWYENVILLGFVYLFFGSNIPLALGAVAITYIVEILIDNLYARLTWRYTIKSAWVVTILFGVTNLIILSCGFCCRG